MASVPLYFYSPSRHESKRQVCVSTFQTLGFSPRTLFIYLKVTRFTLKLNVHQILNKLISISDKIFSD